MDSIIIRINSLTAEDMLTAAWVAIAVLAFWWGWNAVLKIPGEVVYRYTYHQPEQCEALSERYTKRATFLRAQDTMSTGLHANDADHLNDVATGLKRAAKGLPR